MNSALDILKSARGTPLVWSQPRAFTQEYTLTAGERVLAALQWPKTFGSLAEGRIADSTWTFKRVGFWRPAVTIRRPETGDQDVGRFMMDWRRGDLILPGGVQYRWDQVSFWKAEWAFLDAAGKDRLVEFVPENRSFKMSMGVTIHRGVEESADLPLLLLLGWYLLVMASQDDAAAAATVIVG
jgi:hypothetical protein